ncbi:hypothetical protein ACFPK9_01115 [Rubritalea spongiae]|uniref:XRE family transcriptional regulator n=1 Tax=Rubritalea spongiae TaxID=430797 RepID=A0ABW5DYP1_9BACT
MSHAAQEKTAPNPVTELNPKEVRIQLAVRGWTQSDLAKRVKASLTATNLSINHNTYPAITLRIREALEL